MICQWCCVYCQSLNKFWLSDFEFNKANGITLEEGQRLNARQTEWDEWIQLLVYMYKFIRSPWASWNLFYSRHCLCRTRSLFVFILHFKIYRGIVLFFFWNVLYQPIRELEIFQNFVLSVWTIVTLDHIFTSRGKKSDIEKNSVLEVQIIGTN